MVVVFVPPLVSELLLTQLDGSWGHIVTKKEKKKFRDTRQQPPCVQVPQVASQECSAQLIRSWLSCECRASGKGDSASVCLLSHRALGHCARFGFTHYDTVLPDVDVGTDLRCVDHTVLLDEDVVADVQREKRHSARTERKKENERIAPGAKSTDRNSRSTRINKQWGSCQYIIVPSTVCGTWPEWSNM